MDKLPPDEHARPGPASKTLGAVAVVAIVAGVTTGAGWLIPLGVALAVAGGAIFAAIEARPFMAKLLGGKSVGMGAVVERDALVEPGATIEMGATVQREAKVRAGAVVRMGATVERGAEVGHDATVSWGATIGRGAVVGEGASIGAGATVERDATVPAGMRIRPGVTWGATSTSTSTSTSSKTSTSTSTLLSRSLAACEKLERELSLSSEAVRTFVGAPELQSLRRTCEDLARRERALRADADPAAATSLDDERAALEKRLAAEKDPQLRKALEGAVAAIGELRSERELLRVGADRLEAEHSRLVYTLEGLASQLVRLRSEGQAGVPPQLTQGLAELRQRVGAVTDAMRELAVGPPDASDRGNLPPRLDNRDREGHH